MGVLVSLDRAVYFAPRGRKRLMYLGSLISQRYLHPDDRLIGLVGDVGAGKSLLIRGMFPGLVLTNDDNGINVRPLPLLEDAETEHFTSHTYHVDVRFELGFTAAGRLAEAVGKAIRKGRRVVIEHFEMLYPVLRVNAEVLIGIGEEVLVTRPSVFGPEPQEIAAQVFESLRYRKMAHTAEDLTGMAFHDMGLPAPPVHSDVRRGFVLEFPDPPRADLAEVERRVQEYIARDLAVQCLDEDHIQVGEDHVSPCSGPRIHVRRTGEIGAFRLMHEFRYDPLTHLYLVAGVVGDGTGKLELPAPHPLAESDSGGERMWLDV